MRVTREAFMQHETGMPTDPDGGDRITFSACDLGDPRELEDMVVVTYQPDPRTPHANRGMAEALIPSLFNGGPFTFEGRD